MAAGDAGRIRPTELPSNREDFAEYDVIIIGDVPPSSSAHSHAKCLGCTFANKAQAWCGFLAMPAIPPSSPIRNSAHCCPLNYPAWPEFVRSFEDDSNIAVQRLPVAVEAAFSIPANRNGINCPINVALRRWKRVRDLSRVWMVDKAERRVVVSAQFGAGTSVFIAIDETWRWRRNVGDVYLHKFHSQILRFASRARATGHPALAH